MNYLDRGDKSRNSGDTEYEYSAPSKDFTALCQAQMHSLSQSLAMDWGGIYLTQRTATGQTELIPMTIYPQIKATREDSLEESWQPLVINQGKYLKTLPQQIILPLLDETDVIGLLVVVRQEQNWLPQEFNQLEATAQVLSIARKIDLEASQWQQKAQQLEIEKRNQQNYLDDLLHQIKNPVTALRTFARLLLKKIRPQDNQQQTIQGIVRESERIAELLQKRTIYTEELSRDQETSSNFLIADGGKLNLEDFDLPEILEPLSNSAQVIAKEKGLNLQLEIADNLPQIRANPQATTEILSNLIDNAIKYTPSGGQILITAQIGQNGVTTAISDSGYGIQPTEQLAVFERHYRGQHNHPDIPGTGLGLAIVKDLLEKMNGKIELISPTNQGAGSTFIVWLPSIVAP